MGLRSRYKPAEAPVIKIEDEPVQPSERAPVDFNTDKAKPARLLLDTKVVETDPSRQEWIPADGPVITTIDTAIPEPDEATVALMRQLDHLRASEQAQKNFAAQVAAQRAAQMAAQPPTREQKLAMWKQQGMDPEDARFLAENPQMVDHHDVTRVAAEEAEQQGHGRGTEAHRLATRENFHRHLGHQHAQPAGSIKSTPAFFEPPEATRSPAPESVHDQRASIVSAPVSRRDAGGYREPSPRQVRLTGEESAIAAASGISDVEYARTSSAC